jgi:succinylglutamate desuccinylase
MIFDLLAETLDMHIHGTGITDIFIAPDLIQKLFSGEYMIRMYLLYLLPLPPTTR